MSAETRTRIVPKSPQLAEIGRRRTPIVGREHHEGVPGYPQCVQGVENIPDRGIHLGHEIAVGIGLGASDEFRGRHGRRVGRSQGQIEKEGSSIDRPGLGAKFNPRQGFTTKPRMHLLMTKIRTDQPGAPHLRAWTRRNPVTRHRRRSILIQVHKRRHIQGGADAEEPVKSMRQRTSPERLTEIHFLQFLTRAHPIHPQMPLPNHPGGVTLLFEKPRHRQPPRLDQAWIIPVQHTRLEFPPP